MDKLDELVPQLDAAVVEAGRIAAEEVREIVRWLAAGC